MNSGDEQSSSDQIHAESDNPVDCSGLDDLASVTEGEQDDDGFAIHPLFAEYIDCMKSAGPSSARLNGERLRLVEAENRGFLVVTPLDYGARCHLQMPLDMVSS